VELVNNLKPDIIINSGDFVSYGWRELAGYDTILARARSRYGNFAVLGNHDIGTYIPEQAEEGINENLTRINELIRSSGYVLLDNNHSEIKIGTKKISVIGVSTGGRFPDITYGSIKDAVAGLDSPDLMIAVCHDPDQWEKEIAGNTDIQLTFSGHTHGMQMGIITPFLRWSTAKYIYPNWNGIYIEGDQYQYVNRGAGVLAMPFRIWMPPEITVIRLKSELSEK
jgi:predicted MPP superfamily phosphohydrolase